MALVMVWAGVIGWREWPRWWAVREMRAAVEANEPGRFLDAVEAVDSLGVAEAAADDIAALRHRPSPRVRMYAVMALAVLRPRGSAEARELIVVFEDSNEDNWVHGAAAYSLGLFGGEGRTAVPYLFKAAIDRLDPRSHAARLACRELGYDTSGETIPPRDRSARHKREPTLRDLAEALVSDAGHVNKGF